MLIFIVLNIGDGGKHQDENGMKTGQLSGKEKNRRIKTWRLKGELEGRGNRGEIYLANSNNAYITSVYKVGWQGGKLTPQRP